MKYWKEGFYPTQIEGSVEITDEYWQELLDAQSQGKQITTDKNGEPVALFPTVTTDQLITQAKAKRVSLIVDVEWRISRYKGEVVLGLTPTEPLLPILEYIQALRDITSQAEFPNNITWPILGGKK